MTGALLVRFMVGMGVAGLFGALAALGAIWLGEHWDDPR